MHAHDLIVDEGHEGQKVEDIREVLPDIQGPILPEALVVKTIDLGDLARLVVASQEHDPGWIAHFESKQQ